MEHRRIGQLSASVVGMGCNQLGTACDQALTAQIVGEALDAGVNYFDTADEYGRDYSDPNDVDGWGLSEEYLGRALKHHRDEAVIASKFGIPPPGDSSGGGGGAQWIGIAVEASLRRLGTDHLDLYQLHVPDPSVPIGETLEALNGLVRSGKVREIGCCNLSGVELEEAATVAEQAGLAPFASVQSPLNVIQRVTLDDVMPACERLGLAFIPYYPLASGMLTGKYRRGERPSAGTRLTDQLGEEAQARLFSDRTFDRLEALEGYALARGHTLLELAFAWLLGFPRVSAVIAGAAKTGQVSANAGASEWRLSADEHGEVTRVVQHAVAS
jgi:aryl-alcohol dehydrogenase-like predicted oxidoreductase